MRSKSAILRRCSAFAEASSDSLRALSLVGEVRTVARRAPLFRAGHPIAPLVIRSGVVRESALGEHHAVTFRFHGRGDLVGAGSLFSDALDAQLEAYDDCVVLELPVREMHRCMGLDNGLVQGLARWENARVRALHRRLEVLSAGTAQRRLASVLLALAGRFGVRDSRGTIVNLRLTHRELAQLIGSTRETVSVTVAAFRREGWIHVDGKRFVLLDRRALRGLEEGR
jgi:CRP-like cAMP-binding protein